MIRAGKFIFVEEFNVTPQDLSKWINQYQQLRSDYVFTIQPITADNQDKKRINAYQLTVYKTKNSEAY